MATESETRSNPASAPLNPSPDFLRLHGAAAPATTTQSRYVDLNGRDEYDHHIISHRADLDSLDNQIINLDRTIELEQNKLRDSKASLENSYRARARLLHLRSAMLNFVLELEAREME